MARILFVAPFLSGGGAERVASIWASGLAELGGDIHLLLFYRVENEYEISGKVNLHTAAESKNAYDHFNGPEKLYCVRKLLKELKPDIVLPFISYVGILIMLAGAGLPIRIVETVRIDPKYDRPGPAWRLLRSLALGLSKRCIVQTQSQLNYFPRRLQKRMIVLPNPISDGFAKHKKIFTEKKIRNLVAVGRLEKQKNYPMLLKAFARVAAADPELRLRIYGEGSLFDELDAMIERLGLGEQARLCGRTAGLEAALLEADLYVMTSDAEGMPNSLMEAMALGLPCISTDCQTGPSDLIENGTTGLLVPARDEESFLEALEKMIKDVESSIEMGRKARETILSRYGAAASASKLLNYLASV